MLLFMLFIVSGLIGAGRFLVPGHDLTLPGTYEAFAHIWIGVLLTLSFRKNWYALTLLVLLTILEVAMFLIQVMWRQMV